MTGGHQRFKEQLPAYALGALEPAEKGDLEHHLAGCHECRAELDWLAPATAVLAADVEQLEPSPGVKSRLMAAIEADLAENPGVPRSSVQSDPSPSSKRGERRGWWSSLMRPAVLGAVTAALFAGAVIGVALERGGDSSTTSPSRQVVTGSSTNGADAVVIASNGTGTLKMTNLKKLDRDQVYQAWIQRGQEVKPTASLFTPRSDGTATASIPDLEGVDAVMVSAEPTGGSPQPTTAPVITVSMRG